MPHEYSRRLPYNRKFGAKPVSILIKKMIFQYVDIYVDLTLELFKSLLSRYSNREVVLTLFRQSLRQAERTRRTSTSPASSEYKQAATKILTLKLKLVDYFLEQQTVENLLITFLNASLSSRKCLFLYSPFYITRSAKVTFPRESCVQLCHQLMPHTFFDYQNIHFFIVPIYLVAHVAVCVCLNIIYIYNKQVYKDVNTIYIYIHFLCILTNFSSIFSGEFPSFSLTLFRYFYFTATANR